MCNNHVFSCAPRTYARTHTYASKCGWRGTGQIWISNLVQILSRRLPLNTYIDIMSILSREGSFAGWYEDVSCVQSTYSSETFESWTLNKILTNCVCVCVCVYVFCVQFTRKWLEIYKKVTRFYATLDSFLISRYISRILQMSEELLISNTADFLSIPWKILIYR